jgi:phosphopantetheinyl transferase
MAQTMGQFGPSLRGFCRMIVACASVPITACATECDRTGPDAFAISRRALRWVLSHQSSWRIRPEEWTLDKSGRGRPRVLGPDTDMFCSLAYAGGVCVVAATRGRTVGVDLEPLASHPDSDLPWHLLSTAERRLVEGHPSAFLTVWTLKEAFAKERGEGLMGDPAKLDTAVYARGMSGRLLHRSDGGVAFHRHVHLRGGTYAFAFTLGPSRA